MNKLLISIFSITTSYFLFLIHFFKKYTLDGIRYQDWSSDDMMQTLPIQALHDQPLKALWYLHIDPPFLDTLRAALANFFFHSKNGADLLNSVDWAMYHVHALFFGAFCVLLFKFANQLLGRKAAIAFTIFWCLHPAPLVMATLLDLTFIGGFITTWFVFELYRVEKTGGSILKLAAATIFGFYSRSFFQWYFIPIIALSLFLKGVRRNKISKYILICSLAIAPYVVKQYALFHTTSTSTFLGRHKTGVISYKPTSQELDYERAHLNYIYPEKADEFTGHDKENNQTTAEENLIYSRIASKKWSENWAWTIKQLWGSFKINRGKYWLPTSRYVLGPHPIRDRLPWTALYENYLICKGVLSNLAYGCFYFLIALLIFRRKDVKFVRSIISYFLPLGLIWASTTMGNQFGWTEVDRLKFFLEPSIYLFIAWSLKIWLDVYMTYRVTKSKMPYFS